MSTDPIQPTTQSPSGRSHVTMTAVGPGKQQDSISNDSSKPAATAASPESEQNGSKLPRGHRRQQASVGLGIITTDLDLSRPKTGPTADQQESNKHKNDIFFYTTTLALPRPPPPLSPRRENHRSSTAAPSFSPRRPLVGKTPPPSVPSPIPNVYKDTNHLLPRSYSEDGIMPLPSPAPGIQCASVAHAAGTSAIVMSVSKLFPKHRVVSPLQLSPVTPDDNEQSPSPSPQAIIPVIVTSPTLTPGEKNKLPSLVDEPILGDIEEGNHTHSLRPTGLTVPMTREYKFPSPSPVRYTEEDIVGKQIGEYRIGHIIGVGAFSKVYLATRQGIDYAIKMVNKERIAKDARIRSSLEREVGVLKFMDHPSIVGLNATIETEQHLCIVLEYVEGGELFDFVQKMHQQLCAEGRKIDEALVRRIFVELVRVVQWMHEHHVVHRDLKLENILIHMDGNGDLRLKVTDFGLARVIDPEAPILTTRCGSEEYCAPEIVQSMGYDGRKTDTWALGVILYALLVGYLPFMCNPSRGEKVSHLFYRIVSGGYRWPHAWNQHPELAVSSEAKQVVDRILQRNPDKRIALSDIEKLDWFTSPHCADTTTTTITTLSSSL